MSDGRTLARGRGKCGSLAVGVLNTVVDLEGVPNVLKSGVVPVNKGSGNTLCKRTATGASLYLQYIHVKVLELLLLERLVSVFQEANISHSNQSAYKKKVSCADAILATQKVISRYPKRGNQVFM